MLTIIYFDCFLWLRRYIWSMQDWIYLFVDTGSAHVWMFSRVSTAAISPSLHHPEVLCPPLLPPRQKMVVGQISAAPMCGCSAGCRQQRFPHLCTVSRLYGGKSRWHRGGWSGKKGWEEEVETLPAYCWKATSLTFCTMGYHLKSNFRGKDLFFFLSTVSHLKWMFRGTRIWFLVRLCPLCWWSYSSYGYVGPSLSLTLPFSARRLMTTVGLSSLPNGVMVKIRHDSYILFSKSIAWVKRVSMRYLRLWLSSERHESARVVACKDLIKETTWLRYEVLGYSLTK